MVLLKSGQKLSSTPTKTRSLSSGFNLTTGKQGKFNQEDYDAFISSMKTEKATSKKATSSSIETNKDGTMTYTNPNGKSVTVDKGINPYTGTKNKDVKKGTFSNGYQPNNVGGKKLSVVSGASLNIGGNQQNVWTTGSKNYVWSGTENKYYEVYKKNNEWIVK